MEQSDRVPPRSHANMPGVFELDDKEYMRLLDVAFSKLPSPSAATSDFAIPTADVLVQGNKTFIRNIASIADKARRKQEDIARYLSRELAVPSGIEAQQLMISGRFSAEEINKHVRRYFEVYVVCAECHKPDTRLERAGRGMLYLVCEACGARYGIKSY